MHSEEYRESTGRNLLTHSRMQCFRTCQRKHDLMYNRGIRIDRPSAPLRIGGNIHDGLDWRAQGVPIEEVGQRIRDRYASVPEWADAFDWATECERVVCLLHAYDWYYQADGIAVTKTEQSFSVAIINPETCRASRVFRLAGKIDKIVADDAVPCGLMEHKSTGDSIAPLADFWLRVRMDQQVSTYWVAAHELGHPVQTIIYDAIHKPGIDRKKATPVEKRKFKKNGDPYASTLLVDETPDNYRERLWADITSRPEFYFCRQKFARTAKDIEDYRRDLWSQQKLIRQCEVNDWHPRNTGACTSLYRCEFLDVCNDDITEDTIPDGFVKLDYIHPELQNDNDIAATTGEHATQGGTEDNGGTETIDDNAGIPCTEAGSQCS